jgi:hypothetical protein
MKSDSTEVCALIYIYMYIYKYIYILIQSMRSDSNEVCALLSALLPSVRNNKEIFNAYEIGNALYGMFCLQLSYCIYTLNFCVYLLMPYWLGLCVLRRTCKQNRLYETFFYTVIILSKHHHHYMVSRIRVYFDIYIHIYIYVYICVYI